MKNLKKYLVAGGTAAAVHYSILIVLVEQFKMEAFPATMIGLTVATFVNYPLQYYWTFESSSPHVKAFTTYSVVTSISYTINLLCFWVLDSLGVYYILAQMIATGVALVINFWVNSKYTFKL